MPRGLGEPMTSPTSPARAAADVPALARRLAERATRPHTVMEVCGGQTHSIVRWGLDQLLPPDLRLIHGPGCPVCVTPAATIDGAIALARRPGVILCTYGDMVRVPGTQPGVDLLEARAAGGDVRLLTSPLEALALARNAPDHQVVFLAVGFETTSPATALLARQVARHLPDIGPPQGRHIPLNAARHLIEQERPVRHRPDPDADLQPAVAVEHHEVDGLLVVAAIVLAAVFAGLQLPASGADEDFPPHAVHGGQLLGVDAPLGVGDDMDHGRSSG